MKKFDKFSSESCSKKKKKKEKKKNHLYSVKAFQLSVIVFRCDSQNFQVHASMVAYRKRLHSKPHTVAPFAADLTRHQRANIIVKVDFH